MRIFTYSLTTALITFLPLLCPAAAHAQQTPAQMTSKPAAGMHRMMVTPEKAAPAPVEQAAPLKGKGAEPDDDDADDPDKDDAAEDDETDKKPAGKKADLSRQLIKPEALEQWSHLGEVVLLQTRDSVNRMVKVVEADPGAVPPQGLFFLAKGLADQGQMDKAALYYFVGQLRLSFDTTRWPPRMDPADVKRLQADKNKTRDQRGQIPVPSAPRYKNPHEAVALLAANIGAPISQWMLEDPSRGEKVLARVKKWDEETPYAYLPGYGVPEAVAYEDWPKLLAQSREGYYKRINQFLTGLKKLKGQ